MELLQYNLLAFDVIKFIQDLGPVIVSVIALAVSYFLTQRTLVGQERNTRMTFDAQKETEVRQEIYEKLNSFYGPLLQLRQESNQLYLKFSEKYRSQDSEFATLTYLLKGYIFEGNDKVLLEEILKLGEKCESIIHANSGLIDDTELRTTLIPRAVNHFMLLRLAYKGAIRGEKDKYRDLTFPRELDSKLEERKKQLELDLQNLNKKTDL